jgi:HPt (histidine-containing phosphotransfer) domain-containing protein
MTTANDSLNFFVLEAGECLERLDATLASAGPSGPDAIEFVRHARTLRGAALMHRLSEMAELAAGVERAGRSLRDGSIRWSPAAAAALVAAVDDLKILLHNLRIWGPNEEARAARRLADLARLVPAEADRAQTATPGPGSAEAGLAFLAREAMETATALEALENPADSGPQGALDSALGHVHTLRGVAAVHDVPPIPEVLDAVDRAARAIAVAQGAPTAAQMSLFAAAAALLRRTASDLRSLGRSEPATVEERRFEAARDALSTAAAEADHIVPISELFYTDERGGVVSRAASPPTTPADRFRLEVVSLAEHLRGLVREAQSGGTGRVPDRTVTELRGALQSVRNAAESFGEQDVSDFLGTFTEGHPVFDFLTLNAIDDLVALLTRPTASGAGLSARMAELARGRALDSGIAQGLRPSVSSRPAPAPVSRPAATPEPPPAAPTPAPASAPPLEPAAAQRTRTPTGRERMRTPTGVELQALLADGIARFSALGDLPLIEQTEPSAVPPPREERGPTPAVTPAETSGTRATEVPSTEAEQGVVPIEALLYRGEAALARARVVRDSLRHTEHPAPDSLAELYDLLDLATAS